MLLCFSNPGNQTQGLLWTRMPQIGQDLTKPSVPRALAESQCGIAWPGLPQDKCSEVSG